jgi:hypothetical protein
MVVFHHAIIAYTTFAYLNPLNPVKTFSPVVSGERWAALDTVALFNDQFLMPLLFLVSGLFVWGSLTRRGNTEFLRARTNRLGLPFVLGVILLVPATYYPSLLQVSRAFGGDTGFLSFSLHLIRSGFGTAGPLWFLWVLLLFNLLFVGVNRAGWIVGPQMKGERAVLERPLPFFGVLLGASAVAYVPLSAMFGPSTWLGFGPLVFQVSRILHYLVYFAMGVAAGAYGLDRGVFRLNGDLARHAWIWVIAAAMLFLVTALWSGPLSSVPLIPDILFVARSAALTIASIAIALRLLTRRNRILDSLSNNSYGIYIVHYLIVTWIQYGLLRPDLPVPAKAAIAFVGATILSWMVTAALRRIRPVAKVI